MMPSKAVKAMRLMIDDCTNISVATIMLQHNMVSILEKMDIFAVTEEDIQEFVESLNTLGEYLNDFCKHSEPFQGGNK